MPLQVYIEAGCSTCRRARELAVAVARRYLELEVEVIDISRTEHDVPDAVFAVPTYMLDGSVISLGNPSLEELREWLDAALERRDGLV
jgi:hypothetical protein